MAPNCPHHLTAFPYGGIQRYFLTWCTHNRNKLFVEKAAIDLTMEQILRATREETFALIAYCFMPDHVHLLVEGQTEASDCRRFIRRARQYSGYYFSQAMSTRLWQKYGHERVLRNDEDSLAVARYIIENPVRAGLTKRAEDYAWSGSERFTKQQILEADGWTS